MKIAGGFPDIFENRGQTGKLAGEITVNLLSLRDPAGSAGLLFIFGKRYYGVITLFMRIVTLPGCLAFSPIR
ncbi:hypothetical protein NYE70_19260 [Paenibacillus sp. FSL R5-0407]|uniref:hypothetical protein n=1 Tax=Paenibacillus TaxID=44249 RepID=UPI0025B73359|nr:hypothetical protein [Paenibacillus vini]MDN4070059.1 hypothetical protein [Paenibacillus vini]